MDWSAVRGRFLQGGCADVQRAMAEAGGGMTIPGVMAADPEEGFDRIAS
jgi:hypothetical protein